MTKKFVKTDFSNLARKDEKPAPNYYRPRDNDRPPPKPRTRVSSTYQEKSPSVDLRKYFEVWPANEEIKVLVEKFPSFFSEISMHPEPSRNGKSQNDTFKVGAAYNPSQSIEEGEMPDWESEGEVELGEKISAEIVGRVQNIEKKNMGELKQYEKQFLEEELRRKTKLQEEEQAKLKQESVNRTHSLTVPKPLPPAEDSDEEVDIKRTIHVAQHSTALQRSASVSEEPKSQKDEVLHIADDQPGDDDRFKDSSNASDNDDDIFGSADDKDKDEPAPAAQPTAVVHGHIKFVRGQFSMFALSRNVADDHPIWSITNETMSHLQQNLTSEWMDQHYLKEYWQQCPLVCFDTSCNNYIPYEMFHLNHDIKFFQSMKFVEGYNKKLNSKKISQQNFVQQYPPSVVPVGTYHPRKMSEQETHQQPARPGRKYSNNYKAKPQQK